MKTISHRELRNDTSAAMKLLVEEKESPVLADHLQRRAGDHDTLVASLLLHTELHRAANRRPEHIEHSSVRCCRLSRSSASRTGT